MSRVSDALRRAAERKSESEQRSPTASVETVTDDALFELAREPFPIELTEHRRPRPVSPPPAPPAPSVSPASGPAAAPPERPKTEATDVPLRAAKPASLIERIDARLQAKIVVDDTMMASSREQYRRLAAALHHQQLTTGIKIVMIASAVSGEGKTLTASNLALTLSESYQRTVLLIDADLRRPSLHVIFGINASPGLSDGLASGDERKVRSAQVSARLAILPAGEPSADPMAGLTSDRMRRLLDEAREAFDWVIIDTPPVTLMPDANLLAGMVDRAVLIVKADSTPFDLVTRAVEAIGRDRTLGVVLNQATTNVHSPGYYDQYYAALQSAPQ
jgi:capsular exopolysaccharide synthesis family protein